jgi:hypothetical protein
MQASDAGNELRDLGIKGLREFTLVIPQSAIPQFLLVRVCLQ